MTKRKIFDEMMEGVAAMKSHREGKITLRTYKVEAAPLPKVDSKLIRDARKRLHCSRAVFARRFRVNQDLVVGSVLDRRKTEAKRATTQGTARVTSHADESAGSVLRSFHASPPNIQNIAAASTRMTIRDSLI
jgi:putative transcriptional regulator